MTANPGDRNSNEAASRRKLLQALFALFVFDTVVTALAISHFGAAEANPLYWAFQDIHTGRQAAANAIGLRVTLGLAVFYFLGRNATVRLLKLVLVGYAATMMVMVAMLVRALLPQENWQIIARLVRLISSGYAIAMVAVIFGLAVQLFRYGRLPRSRR